MANDRLFVRCTKCGAYEVLAKWYPGGPALGNVRADALVDFLGAHIRLCQPQDGAMISPVCVVFDNEDSFCAAGGAIGGTGNINSDMERYKRNG